MLLLERRIRLVALVVAAGSILAFWSASLAESTLRRSWIQVRRETQRPPLLSGLFFRLDRFVSPQVAPGTASRYLVIVLSDDCQFSAQQMPKWTTLIRTLPFRPSDEVLLITTSGRIAADRLATFVASRSVRGRRIEIVQRAGFTQETGVSWTPATLVLDGRMRVRLVAERITEVVESSIKEMFDDV